MVREATPSTTNKQQIKYKMEEIEMEERKMEMFNKMRDLVVKNAREVAHNKWDYGEVEDAEMLRALADKFENGTITDTEFDELVERLGE